MQGTRQGSICAPFHYTIHVNGLLDELQRSVHGLRVGELKLSAPTQADDIVLLSTLRLGIEKVVSICRNYANKWRYSYNAAKCASMVMSHKQARCHRPEAIRYDNSNITETTVYKHLGVTQSPHGKQPYTVDQVKRCIRGTHLVLATLVAGQDGANPLTLYKLYSLSVLPKALFGCEQICVSLKLHTTSALHTRRVFSVTRDRIL